MFERRDRDGQNCYQGKEEQSLLGAAHLPGNNDFSIPTRLLSSGDNRITTFPPQRRH
jgi:hypothetical protein